MSGAVVDSSVDAPRAHGLLFSDRLPGLIERGVKTQTRRLVTRYNTNFDGHGRVRQVIWDELDFSDVIIDPGPSPLGNAGPYMQVLRRWKDGTETRHRLYPVVQVARGDTIYTKETWAPSVEKDVKAYYRGGPRLGYGGPWKSSIHQPRRLARFEGPALSAKPERLQSISEEDALADGGWVYANCPFHKAPEKSFFELWDTIHGEGSARSNPLVWAYRWASPAAA